MESSIWSFSLLFELQRRSDATTVMGRFLDFHPHDQKRPNGELDLVVFLAFGASAPLVRDLDHVRLLDFPTQNEQTDK